MVRVRRAARTAVLAAVLLASALPAAAELASSVTLSAYGTVARVAELDPDPLLRLITRPAGPAASAVLKTRLDLQSEGNENVKGQLQLDGWLADSLYLDVPRAWIKVRLPWLRLTVGKTRLSKII